MTSGELKHAFCNYSDCEPITDEEIIALYLASQQATNISRALQAGAACELYFRTYSERFEGIIRHRKLDDKIDQ